jgi:ATP-dependent DNA helicase RecG
MNEHNKLVIFQDKKIRRIWYQEEWFYSVIDIVRALTDSVNARDYWYKMKIRLGEEEKAELSTICLQLKMPAEDTFFQIYEKLSKKIEIPFSIQKGVRNDDPPQLQAIREALVNLLIHTDYFSKSNPRIRIFMDRFEFFNPGALPKDIELILKEDFSLPRNPIIARIFRFVKFSESIGSGFDKMIQGWKEYYKSKPIIEGDFDYYKISFPFNKTTNKTTNKTMNKTTNKIEDEIITLLKNNHTLSMFEIAQKLKITQANVQYYINKIKKSGRLERIGSKKSGEWIIK